MSAQACPGCGRSGVNPNRLGCQECWFRLPLSIRRRWSLRNRERRPLTAEAREQIVTDAHAWWQANGAPQRTPP